MSEVTMYPQPCIARSSSDTASVGVHRGRFGSNEGPSLFPVNTGSDACSNRKQFDAFLLKARKHAPRCLAHKEAHPPSNLH